MAPLLGRRPGHLFQKRLCSRTHRCERHMHAHVHKEKKKEAKRGKTREESRPSDWSALEVRATLQGLMWRLSRLF